MADPIHPQILQVLQDVLDAPALEVTRATTAEEVDGWDSLAHVRIILTLERALGVRFAAPELARLKNVGDLDNLIRGKRGER